MGLYKLFAIFINPRDFMKAWQILKDASEDVTNLHEVKDPEERGKYSEHWSSFKIFDELGTVKINGKDVNMSENLLILENVLRGFKSTFEDSSSKALDATLKVISSRVKKLTEISKTITGILKTIELINNNKEGMVDMRGLIVAPQPGGLSLLKKNLANKSLLNRPDEEEPFCMLMSFVGGGPGIATIYNLLFSSTKTAKMKGDLFDKDIVSAYNTLVGQNNDDETTDRKERLKRNFGYDKDLIAKKQSEASKQLGILANILSGNVAAIQDDADTAEYAKNLLEDNDMVPSQYGL